MNINSEARRQSPGSPEDQAQLARLRLIGHDLRAALCDILGGLRLVSHDRLDDPTRLQLERVRASGELLARLLEEGLTLVAEQTGIGSGPAVEIAGLLYDLEMRWKGAAREKGLEFQIALAPDVPSLVRVDRLALDRALGNILSNAIKFTDAGAVRVTVMLEGEEALRFCVVDDGPGFGAELAQLGTAGARGAAADKPGEGLGLFIAKGLAARMGGALELANRAEGGAWVSLRVPMLRPVPMALAPSTPLPDLAGRRILVAEDSETNQIVLSHMLAAMGTRCVLVSDGEEALAALEAAPFDLAIVDIEMPRLSGIELMRLVRGGVVAGAEGLPIVACTAYVLRANRDAIYAAGADAIMAKPLIGMSQLSAAIDEAMTRAGRRGGPGAAGPGGAPAQAAAEAGAQATGAAEADELDTGELEQLLVLAGPSGARELLSRLIADLKRVEGGLDIALPHPDIAAIRAQTHVLSSVAGAVGAMALYRATERLNSAAHDGEAEAIRIAGRAALVQIDRLIHYAQQQAAARREEPQS